MDARANNLEDAFGSRILRGDLTHTMDAIDTWLNSVITTATKTLPVMIRDVESTIYRAERDLSWHVNAEHLIIGTEGKLKYIERALSNAQKELVAAQNGMNTLMMLTGLRV